MNKENVVTPTRQSAHENGSPTGAARLLKPVSPNKNVGKLNFLQNDNIDTHFDSLHASQEEIKQQLDVILLETRQTNADLGQLFEKLKNNNQHLNKLLDEIARYSSEVTTEGHATKADFKSLLERIDKLAVDDLSRGILDNQRLLAELTSTLKNEKHIDGVMQKHTRTITDHILQSTSNLKQEQLETKYSQLEGKYAQLEKDFALLSDKHDRKLQDYNELLLRFAHLEQLADKLIAKVEGTDLQRYDKVRQVHSSRMEAVSELPVTSSRKRIVSMPHKP